VRGTLVALAAWALVGCPGPGAPPGGGVPGRCDDPVEAGLACMELLVDQEMRPVVDEAPVELVFGPQGGWHLDVGVRFAGLDPAGATLTYVVVRERDRAELSRVRFAINPRRLVSVPPYQLRPRDLAILDVASASEVVGERVTIETRIEDAEGAELARDVVTLRVVDEDP
jgi:hypothetical protein